MQMTYYIQKTQKTLVYIETLELINEFSKVTGYKINIQKLAAFLYTNNEISKKKCKQITPFKVALKNTQE